MKVLLTLFWLVVVASTVTDAAEVSRGTPDESSTAVEVDFLRDVRPIFVKHCYGCHGPDEQSGGLRLDQKAAAQKGGDSGPAFLPGRSQESRLIAYVSGADPLIVMPPDGPPLEAQAVDVLRRWIDQGASWPDSAADPWAAARSHWAFQPVTRPAIPTVHDRSWLRNPVDSFVLERLEHDRIVPANEADRPSLIRRVYLDLIGLPPDVKDVERFIADNRPDAFERLVDRLLASPHFGERWGRHWLDLARYADSDGYEDDRYRPDAWRYRDWVISAINRDQPFDEFTIQQLAGDLLCDANYDHKVAVGFHRMTLFNRSAAGRNDDEYRVKATKDRVNTTATVWLGLTMGCAECHSHKYDPVSHEDYYRFYAFFNNLVDTDIEAPPLPDEYAQAHAVALAEFEHRQAKAQETLAAYVRDTLPARQAHWERTVDGATVPEQTAAVLAIDRDQRTGEQTEQLSQYFRSIDDEYARLDAAVFKGDQVPNNRPQPPSSRALSLTECAEPRETFIQLRGDFLSKGETVRAGAPSFLPPLRGGSLPNRYDLARWIVAAENPLTSRVAANRIWQHLFGQPLLATPENFGLQSEKPSHPKLLNWLASELIGSGWNQKHLIRTIVTSATYRQCSRFRAELADADPYNRLLARQNRFRAEAEIVRDLGLAVAGILNRGMGGPSVQPPLPASLLARQELQNERFMPPSSGADRFRRGIYVNVQRTFANPMLKDFDTADANVTCIRRDRSNTPLQALTLLNDPVTMECARQLGLRVVRECNADVNDRVDFAFQLALVRRPTRNELEILASVYHQHRALYAADQESTAALFGAIELPANIDRTGAAAWVAVARTIMNLDEFITRE